MLEQMRQSLGVSQIIYRYNLDITALKGNLKSIAPNPTKTIDGYLGFAHYFCTLPVAIFTYENYITFMAKCAIFSTARLDYTASYL